MLGGNIISSISGKYETFGTYRQFPNKNADHQIKLDLTDEKNINAAVKAADSEFIIHCAAATNVDFCEENYALARTVNALSIKSLIESAGPKTRFIYVSTDAVFDGKSGNYSENDLPSPVNNYARTKLEGEWLVEQFCSNYVIIRTNMFGWNQVHGESFAEWIIANLSKKNPIKMFTDVIFSPISAFTLSKIVIKLLDSDFVGRLNIGCSAGISKYKFGMYISDIFKLESSFIKPVSVDSFPFKAKRPKNTSLNISKAKKILGTMPEIEEEISVFYKKRRKDGI